MNRKAYLANLLTMPSCAGYSQLMRDEEEGVQPTDSEMLSLVCRLTGSTVRDRDGYGGCGCGGGDDCSETDLESLFVAK